MGKRVNLHGLQCQMAIIFRDSMAQQSYLLMKPCVKMMTKYISNSTHFLKFIMAWAWL